MLRVTAEPEGNTYEVAAETPAGDGTITGLAPDSCLHLALMLARSARSAGATWPTLYPDDVHGFDVLKGLKEACGESNPQAGEHDTELAYELRHTVHDLRRYVMATSQALGAMERVLGE